MVALLAEGVDRNTLSEDLYIDRDGVALLAEGVDRNLEVFLLCLVLLASPSSRRAWIEIYNP